MAAIKEIFSKKILSIDGIEGFVLARDDGAVLAHRIDALQPAAVAAMMVLNGIGCYHIKTTMGFSNFNYMLVTLKNNTTLAVFPIRNYFLGVIGSRDGFTSGVIARIRRFIDTVKNQTASGPKES